MGYEPRRKYLKIIDDQIKQFIETKKTSCKQLLATKKVEDKIEYKKKHSVRKERSEKKTQSLLWQICSKSRHETYGTQPEVYKILKQISKDIKETVKIQENIVEMVFLQYYEKLWNTTHINEPILEWKSYNYVDTLITLDELKKP